MLAGKRHQGRLGAGQYKAHLDYNNTVAFLIEGQIVGRNLIGKAGEQTALHAVEI